MNKTCEVVPNTANGKEFFYCREHKLECMQSGCYPKLEATDIVYSTVPNPNSTAEQLKEVIDEDLDNIPQIFVGDGHYITSDSKTLNKHRKCVCNYCRVMGRYHV